MNKFIDTVNDELMEEICQEIAKNLFMKWNEEIEEKGNPYIDFSYMLFAPDEIKKEYNEFYGYNVGDDLYLEYEEM